MRFAQVNYAQDSDDNIEVDDDATVSEGDDGVFVQAWVWCSDSDVEEFSAGE